MKPLPALHQAVVENDLSAIRVQLFADPSVAEVKDSLGFSALDLAYLLNRKSAATVLSPGHKHFIKVMAKGSKTIARLNTEQFLAHFKVAYLSHQAFSDYAALERVLNNCPWVLAKSFLGEENREQAITFTSQLTEGQCADISIRWINAQLGYGIFAETDLPEGSYVGEFTGLVRQLYRRKPDHNEYCFHYPTKFWSWNYYLIDALEMGNETRFINHSDNPNLQPLCLCEERRLLHIVFVTNKPVVAGTQLTYDYGQDFWKKRHKIDI